jgi:hypothetical protein
MVEVFQGTLRFTLSESLLKLETSLHSVWGVSGMTGQLTPLWGCKIHNIRPQPPTVHPPLLLMRVWRSGHGMKQMSLLNS